MNWLAFIIAFGFSAIVGGIFAKLSRSNRPQWSARRRLWVSASIMPAFIGLLTVAGLAWVLLVGPGTGENMQDLALIVTAAACAIFAAVALAGGLIGASLGAPR